MASILRQGCSGELEWQIFQESHGLNRGTVKGLSYCRNVTPGCLKGELQAADPTLSPGHRQCEASMTTFLTCRVDTGLLEEG